MSRIVDIEPLLKELEKELKEFEGCTEVETFEESVEDAISELERLPVINIFDTERQALLAWLFVNLCLAAGVAVTMGM